MLNLTDQQIKDLSLTTLQLPLVIDNPTEGNGLIQMQQYVVDDKARLETIDTQNKIFTDHWITVLGDYYSELEELDKTIKSPYSESVIIAGGKSTLPHYDDTSWINISPMVSDVLQGNPTSIGPGPDENELLLPVNDNIDKMINGFSGTGVIDTTLLNPYTLGSGAITLTLGALTPGELIIIDNAGISMIAEVGASGGFCTGETPSGSGIDESTCLTNGGLWTNTEGIIPLSTDISFPAGARVRNFHIGFNDSERGHQTTNYAFDVMVYFQNELDGAVSDWKDSMTIQSDALSNNGDLIPANEALNLTALSNVNSVLSDTNTWILSVIIGINGKYTDSKLPLISDSTILRLSQIPLRIVDLNNNLGTIAQSGDGSTTGAGVYKSLYDFVNIRIAKAGGALYGFYVSDTSIGFIDAQVATSQSQLDQYNNTFAIASLINDTIVGQIEFEVDSVSEFLVGHSVKVMDNNSVIFSRTIDTINGTTIRLDSGVPSVLLLVNDSRIVRQK
jgi:hypothetical protein